MAVLFVVFVFIIGVLLFKTTLESIIDDVGSDP